jgi:hypothetical protein
MIRMGLSGLNSHRFTYNMIAFPLCDKYSTGPEDTIHFLWYCPMYALIRQHMLDRLMAELNIQQTATTSFH